MTTITIPHLPIPCTLAIAHGLATDDAGPITITEALLAPLDAEERAIIGMCATQQQPALRNWLGDLPAEAYVALIRQPDQPDTWSAACAAVRRVREDLESVARATRDRKIADAIAAPLDISPTREVRLGRYLSFDILSSATPQQRAAIAARLAEGEPEHRRVSAAAATATAAYWAAQEAKTATAAAAAAAKDYHLRARLESLAPALAQQWDDHLLCRDEAIRVVASAALDPIASVAPQDGYCANTDCPCGVCAVDCLPPAIYRRLLALRATLPADATLTDYQRSTPHGGDIHIAMGPKDELPDPTYTACLTVQDGPLTFQRRIVLE